MAAGFWLLDKVASSLVTRDNFPVVSPFVKLCLFMGCYSCLFNHLIFSCL